MKTKYKVMQDQLDEAVARAEASESLLYNLKSNSYEKISDKLIALSKTLEELRR
jgi:hypothetical protein